MKRNIILTSSIIFALVLGYYLGHKNHGTKAENEPTARKKQLFSATLDEPFNEKAIFFENLGGLTSLKSEDLSPGTEGAAVEIGTKVDIHYVGRLPDGKVFDSSKRRYQPFAVNPGSGGTIVGLEMGILGMKEKGTRRIYVPAYMGYGEKGAGGGLVPPNSPLIYDVEVLSISKSAANNPDQNAKKKQ